MEHTSQFESIYYKCIIDFLYYYVYFDFTYKINHSYKVNIVANNILIIFMENMKG